MSLDRRQDQNENSVRPEVRGTSTAPRPRQIFPFRLPRSDALCTIAESKLTEESDAPYAMTQSAALQAGLPWAQVQPDDDEETRAAASHANHEVLRQCWETLIRSRASVSFHSRRDAPGTACLGLCGDSLIAKHVAPGGFVVVAVGEPAVGIVVHRPAPSGQNGGAERDKATIFVYDTLSAGEWSKGLTATVVVKNLRQLNTRFSGTERGSGGEARVS